MTKRLTVNEIAECLEEIENEENALAASIYIQLPENASLSDEDSADEESDINRLSGNQLRGFAEATVTKVFDGEAVCVHIGSTNPESDNEGIISTPNRSVKNISNRHSNLPKPQRKWIKSDIAQDKQKEWMLPDFLSEDYSPVDLFELFYDDEIINMLVTYSNMYACQKNEAKHNVTSDEMRVLLAILLLSGYVSVPRYRMYWEESSDSHNTAIAAAISRNRFEQILKYLHLCDNFNLDENDKFAKVRSLWNMLNKRWVKYYPNDSNICIDEAMVLYFGRYSTKQHLHGKPIRFGYKVWCCCTRLGYLIQGEPYQGAQTGNTRPELGVGVGGSVVLDLLSKLPDTAKYNVYFDNYFTSIPLLEELKKEGHNGTGTIRANRTTKAPLIDGKILQKRPRGSFDQVTDTEAGVTLIRYNDSSIVTIIASTEAGVTPLGNVRFSFKDKRKIDIPQPAAIINYNTYMGGVDRLDQNVAGMRINIRMKKWYWQLFSFPLNASVTNAWQLYRLTSKYKEKPLDLLAFTRKITIPYLQKYAVRTNIGRPPRLVRAVNKRVSEEVRFDRIDHVVVPKEKQSRCALCKKNTTKKCMKCDVALHTNCFQMFHTK